MLLRRSSPARRSLVVIAIGVLALAACGGSDTKAGVATLSKDKASSSAASNKRASTASFRTQLLAYAKCMRDNGVDFPDPQFDSNGRPQFHRQGGLRGPVDHGFAGLNENPAFEKARTACNDTRPDFARKSEQTPAQRAETRTTVLKFAKCMREKGIDFPDPTFDARGRPQANREGAANGVHGQDPEGKATQAARQKCQQSIGGAFGGHEGSRPAGT